MSLRETFAELAASGSSPWLLGNCKLEWAGAEIYGEEAIAEAFRAAPLIVEEGSLFVDSAQQAAWFGGESVLFADLYDGRIARMWRIGPGDTPRPEPAVSVAFDPDLRQLRGSVYARAGDHPLLNAAHFAAIHQTADEVLAPPPGTRQHRARAFLIRAFSSGDCGAALLAVHRLSGGDVRSNSLSFAAVAIDGGRRRIILDQRPQLGWTPRF